MRLKSSFFVSALLNRLFKAGAYGAVLHKGAEDAGAIFLLARHRDGTASLAGPAPQSLNREDDGERRFELRLDHAEPDAIDQLMAREIKFDPDLWFVEVEGQEIADIVEVVFDNQSD